MESLTGKIIETLKMAERGLEGKYPWPIAGKHTKKEAREITLNKVRDTLSKIQAHLRSIPSIETPL